MGMLTKTFNPRDYSLVYSPVYRCGQLHPMKVNSAQPQEKQKTNKAKIPLDNHAKPLRKTQKTKTNTDLSNYGEHGKCESRFANSA